MPEAAALAAALCWSLCSLAFASAGRRVGALAVNQTRIIGAVLLLGLMHVAWLGNFWPTHLSWSDQGWLALSGFVGLTLGDLCYFAALRDLGPRVGLLLHGTWPVMAAVLAWAFLGEQLDSRSATGVTLVVLGTGLVVAGGDRQWSKSARAVTPADADATDTPGTTAADNTPPSDVPSSIPRAAIVLGLLGALGQAAGAVLAKEALDDGAHALSATLVRMVAGAGCMLLITFAIGSTGAVLRSLRDREAGARIALGTLLGPVLGVWLSMIALQGTRTGAAAALLATAPIWMVPIGRMAYGSRLTLPAAAGTALAIWGSVQLLG